MNKRKEKLLQYFWDKKRHSFYDGLPLYLITFLDYGTLGNSINESSLRMELIQLVKEKYLEPIDNNFDLFFCP